MASPLPETSAVARTPNQPWCDLGAEVVVLRVKDNAYYRFDGTGRAIWLLLDEPRTTDDLTAALGREFSGDPAAIRQDVKSFLARCADLGLVGLAAVAG